MSRKLLVSHKLLSSIALGTMVLGLAAAQPAPAEAGFGVSHVLLISIDGMHALDFANCARGIAGMRPGQNNRKASGRTGGPTGRPNKLSKSRDSPFHELETTG